MLSALSAEALKLTRHKATWFLVWVYPICITAIFLLAIGLGLSGVESPSAAPAPAKWIEETATIWLVPPHMLGRYLISAYVAVAFAGEYGWNTWKLIVPHRARWMLIAAKYLVTVALLYLAYALSGALTVVLSLVEDSATGDTIPNGITASALIEAHWRGAMTALLPILLTVAYTSLAAVLTRSMVAALVIGIVVATFEQIFLNFAPLLSAYAPQLVLALFHALPGYHLANLESWMTQGAALQSRFPTGAVVALPLATSLAVTVAWISGLAALTVASFKRQDIN